LSHYYKEIRPVVKSLAFFGGVDELIEERNDDLVKVHPIEPSSIPNFALGMKDRLPSTSPESIFKSSHLQLMDAGMSNNLPIYPLLRPGRDVDILIAFDASADIKTENWLSVVDGYARQRGIKGWPIGAGWPKADSAEDTTVKELDVAEAASPQAAVNIADAREDQREHIIVHSRQSRPESIQIQLIRLRLLHCLGRYNGRASFV
jgi:phospholipase A2